MALSAPSFQLFDDIRGEVAADPELQTVVVSRSRGKEWRMIDDLTTVHGRVYVPASSPLLQTILEHANDVGHEGTQKTEDTTSLTC
jgi:hypothetical protein